MGYFLKFKVDDNGVLQYNKVNYKGKEIPYEVLRNEIGNIIQYVYYVWLGDEGLAIVTDEEGLLRQLKPTFWLYSPKLMKIEPYPLVGNILVVRVKNNKTYGLIDSDVEKVLSVIMRDNRSGAFLLPLNDDYIRESNQFMNDFFNDLNR